MALLSIGFSWDRPEMGRSGAEKSHRNGHMSARARSTRCARRCAPRRDPRRNEKRWRPSHPRMFTIRLICGLCRAMRFPEAAQPAPPGVPASPVRVIQAGRRRAPLGLTAFGHLAGLEATSCPDRQLRVPDPPELVWQRLFPGSVSNGFLARSPRHRPWSCLPPPNTTGGGAENH